MAAARARPTSTASNRVVLAGELDIADVARVARLLARAVERGDAVVRLDVRDVTFIDLSCVHVIDEARIDLESRGRRLQITEISPWFQRVCVLAGYDELVTPPDPITPPRPRRPPT